MTLLQKQTAFVRLIGKLIEFAYQSGYELTFGDSFAKTGHMPGSMHYIRLAQDFNLFKNGVWLKKTEDHTPLGMFWEELGKKEGVETCWGGRFKKPDGNHYSIAHNGKK